MPESHSWKCLTTIGGGPGRRDTNCDGEERKEGGGGGGREEEGGRETEGGRKRGGREGEREGGEGGRGGREDGRERQNGGRGIHVYIHILTLPHSIHILTQPHIYILTCPHIHILTHPHIHMLTSSHAHTSTHSLTSLMNQCVRNPNTMESRDSALFSGMRDSSQSSLRQLSRRQYADPRSNRSTCSGVRGCV